MTDTTITPEERAALHDYATRCSNAPCKVLLMPEWVFALLASLEAAEGRAERADSAQLRAERDWLAAELAELHDTSLMLVDGAPEGSNRSPYWIEAARRAVAGEGE